MHKSLAILIPRQTVHELGLVHRQRMLFMPYKNGLKVIPLEPHQAVTQWTQVRNLCIKNRDRLRVVLPSAMCQTLGLKAMDVIKIKLNRPDDNKFFRPDPVRKSSLPPWRCTENRQSIWLPVPSRQTERLTKRVHASEKSCRTRLPQKYSAGWKSMMQANSQKRLKRICGRSDSSVTRPRNRASRTRFRRKSNFNN